MKLRNALSQMNLAHEYVGKTPNTLAAAALWPAISLWYF